MSTEQADKRWQVQRRDVSSEGRKVGSLGAPVTEPRRSLCNARAVLCYVGPAVIQGTVRLYRVLT